MHSGGIVKRPIELIPDEYRQKVKRFSKADLAEIAWDLAYLLTGGDESTDAATFHKIEVTNRILAHHRKVVAYKQAVKEE